MHLVIRVPLVLRVNLDVCVLLCLEVVIFVHCKLGGMNEPRYFLYPWSALGPLRAPGMVSAFAKRVHLDSFSWCAVCFLGALPRVVALTISCVLAFFLFFVLFCSLAH